MLVWMPSEAANVPPGTVASGFAKLFAGLTASKAQDRDARADAWIDDALADDVATISYEQALRTHARYRRPDLPPLPVAELDPEFQKPPQSVRITEWVPENSASSLQANRKLASITIRLTRSECNQLRERATAAGLTVSAYLRSCIFEAETLRAQVKDALQQIHSEKEREGVRVESSPKDWRARFFAHWSRNRNQPDA